MSISKAKNVLNRYWISYEEMNEALKVQGPSYHYVIEYDDEESKFSIVTYGNDDNDNSVLDFSMSIYPMQFHGTEFYFEKWFKGVKEVIVHYYMEKNR
ncbi:hypothetical protein XaC1_359 [Xanthomonas phage XaC1]|nr:hypothetical protein XaC1_359 [Xanthomonas phage XaC1]